SSTRDWSSDVCPSDLILEQEGYISGSSIENDSSQPRPRLRIAMKYTPDRKRTISGLRRVSKPGLRVYTPANKLPRVLGGMGIAKIRRASWRRRRIVSG